MSGSQDKTARLWDLRASAAINVITSPSPGESEQDTASGYQLCSILKFTLHLLQTFLRGFLQNILFYVFMFFVDKQLK